MRTRILLLIAFFQLATLAFGQKYEMYGVNTAGGDDLLGTIFKLDKNGNNLSLAHSFNLAPMLRTHTSFYAAPNGKLYGMSISDRNKLTIFEFNRLTNQFRTLHEFNSLWGHAYNGGFIVASNGNIYGVASVGGTNSDGYIFEFNLSTNVFTKLYDFNLPTGIYPSGSLFQASNGKLYGLTSGVSNIDHGTLYEFNISTNTYRDRNFNGSYLGSKPIGSLTQASNSKLYGVASEGGLYNKGTIFSYDLITDSLLKVADFDGINGAFPSSEPIQASNGKLYGYTNQGGISNNGAIYEYDYVTKVQRGMIYFTSSIMGKSLVGKLVESGNNTLLGLSNEGGIHDEGVLFEYDYSTNSYTKKIDFNINSEVYKPESGLLKISNNEFIATSEMGVDTSGNLFEYNYSTSKIKNVIPFNARYFGGRPSGSIKQASNGMLYGTTSSGGLEHGAGVIYELNPSNYRINNKVAFNYRDLAIISPKGEFVITKDNKLIGFADSSNTRRTRVLYEYDIDNDTLSIVHVFDTWSNQSPTLNLIQHSNGFVYGTKFKIVNNVESTILIKYDVQSKTFSEDSVLFPYKANIALCDGPSGLLYGVCNYNNINGYLFSLDLATDSLTILHNFQPSTGRNPSVNPIIADNGKLYGTTAGGGANDMGVLYEFDIISNTYTKKVDFNGVSNGQYPSFTGLSELKSGKLYGYAKGGLNNGGVLFEYDINSSTLVNKYDFGLSNIGVYPIGMPIMVADCPLKRDTFSLTTCQKYISPSGRYTWTVSGIHRDTIVLAGCDSVLTINLTLKKVDMAVQTLGANSLASNNFNATFQWLDCNNNYAIIPNETGQLFTATSTGNYAVQVTSNTNGCVDTSTCFPITIVGFNENQLVNNLAVFPNPTNGNVKLSLGGMYGALLTQVYNVNGKLINESMHQSTNQVDVELGDSEGIYFIHLITNSGEKVVRKVVKN